jgi:beta-lactamase regulating signal transducer with metallopeptidase domain
MMITDFIYYDLKVAALLAVFYLFYQLLLARETTYRLNRMVLLTAIGLSLVLPLCVVTLHETVVIDHIPQAEIEATTLSDAPTATTELTGQNVFGEWMLLAVLVIGSVIRLLYVLHGYRKLQRLIASGEQQRLSSGTEVRVVESQVAPFSWMHTVVLSRSEWQSPLASVLAHEEAHVRHRHSYDVVVVEVLTALQWFNPVVWFLRQELRTLHEYEADASVLSSGFDESQYIHLLMQKATGIQACALANGINNHRTKKRILMMLKPKSNRIAWLKALYLVPIILASIAMSARTVIDYKSIDVQDSWISTFQDDAHGKGECYQIRYQPGVKFFHNGKEETIPGNRPIALEASKTVLQSNGEEVSQLTLSQIPTGMLKEIHLDEVSPDHFVANFITEEKGKTVYIVDGERVSQEDVSSVKKDDIATVDVISNREWLSANAPEADNAVIIQTKQSDEPVLDKCEQMPSFPGGDVKLMEFIAKNIKYPQQAIECGLQGRVLVQFIVEKDGTLSNAKALENPKKSQTNMVVVNANMPDKQRQDAEAHNRAVQALRDEAIRVVNAMPKWNAGMQRGKAVRTKFVIPISYRLN